MGQSSFGCRGGTALTNVTRLFPDLEPLSVEVTSRQLAEAKRIVEALLFAANQPLAEIDLARRLPAGTNVVAVLEQLRRDYETRGVHLVRIGGGWLFRTADDLAWLLSASARETKKLSRAATETLAIIAYHQPATRADIEEIRGVAVAKGTLDVLLETGWIRPRGRRRSPGRPITYGTTNEFLLQFGLQSIADLPGLEELRAAGLFDERLQPGFSMPLPRDGALDDDEDPLDDPEPEDDYEALDDGLTPRDPRPAENSGGEPVA